ncbi:GNAT family N-acetyltransferase [Nocardioides massiliensis]|uniref:RimJ/RimL family protein N-acetyltransferase n=1 Tax=Nocardioides massiliensis TaxID=1325935 RepID=A0ABT9NQJ7_9ACTN|nr:GNAT family N-acetyltransferase [Nocardioides massiliensis]MDP9822699.1 RimJ/RimL family protein N-acetyltransferase [Nocardioides massiliensis]
MSAAAEDTDPEATVEIRVEPFGQPPPPARHRGEVGAGQGWYAAARELARDRVPDHAGWQLLAEDLADSPRRFVLVEFAGLAFRPLTRGDLRDLVRWQQAEHVAPWWRASAVDLAAAETRYGPAIDGTDPTRHWIVERHGRSIGWVQDYRVADHPDWALTTAPQDSVGIDYLIGEPAHVGRGIGTRMLSAYLTDVVAPAYDAPVIFAAPDHRNRASLRVLDKLGFTQGVWFDCPVPGGEASTVIGCTLDVAATYGY